MISSWRTQAEHLANLFASQFSPFIRTDPSIVNPLVFLVILPVIIDSNEDFPAPDCPITVKNSPLLTFPSSEVRMLLLVLLWISPRPDQQRLFAIIVYISDQIKQKEMEQQTSLILNMFRCIRFRVSMCAIMKKYEKVELGGWKGSEAKGNKINHKRPYQIFIISIFKEYKQMSCFSCQHCHCNLSTQTKTELIIYPSGNNSFRGPSLHDYTFKVQRNKKEINTDRPSQIEQQVVGRMEQKIGETMDTISKIISVPSTHRINDQISSASFTTIRKDQIQQARSHIVNNHNKQNNSLNLSNSILHIQPKANPNSVQKINSHIKLPTKPNAAQSICKSNVFEGKSMRISQHNLPTPSSSQISEKNLSVILYEKENNQLREELRRLKQKQNELLAQQFKIKEKNNREIGHLKKRSQELEARSSMRKKQLNELKNLLKLVEKAKEQEDSKIEKLEI